MICRNDSKPWCHAEWATGVQYMVNVGLNDDDADECLHLKDVDRLHTTLCWPACDERSCLSF